MVRFQKIDNLGLTEVQSRRIIRGRKQPSTDSFDTNQCLGVANYGYRLAQPLRFQHRLQQRLFADMPLDLKLNCLCPSDSPMSVSHLQQVKSLNDCEIPQRAGVNDDLANGRTHSIGTRSES